jgi:DNA-binding CsgD family transcriptional regulator
MARRTTRDGDTPDANPPPLGARRGAAHPEWEGDPGEAAVLAGGDAELLRLAPAALAAALEAIPSPAFVVRAPAQVLLANGRGRALLEAERERVVRALSSGAAEGGRFAVEAAPELEVVVVPDIDGDARSRLAGVTRRWGLTPRQSAVLALVAQGESNRTVATHLGCSEKTVELHVSALLAKTRCASRAQLVAAFWTDAG